MFTCCRLFPRSVKPKGTDVVALQKRFKNSSNHWAVKAKHKKSTDKALDHFDDFYGNVFGEKWPSIRLALLSANKYFALVNNYSDINRITQNLEGLGAMDLRSLLDVQGQKIKENRKIKTRKKEMNQIFKLDKKMEELYNKRKDEELQELFVNESPQENNESRECPDVKSTNERFIDGSVGLSDAVLQEFIPATRLKGREDFIPESQHYSYYSQKIDFPVVVKQQARLDLPSELKLFTFEMGNISQFPRAKKGSTGVSDYYLLDGGSILPVLALDLKPGDKVLDMCAAPGGKSLLCLQTLYPKTLVCNDISISRTNRIKRIMYEFLYDFDKKQQNGEIVIVHQDGRFMDEFETFNKILVDVPCTTDRHALKESDNNIFKPTRLKERLKLPEMQAQLLVNALKLVQPGGTVVYSTCSLSPVQNDGVVNMALRNIWQETDFKISVIDLKKAIEPASIVLQIGKDVGLRYGHLILPYLPANYGPTYFCKLVKEK